MALRALTAGSGSEWLSLLATGAHRIEQKHPEKNETKLQLHRRASATKHFHRPSAR